MNYYLGEIAILFAEAGFEVQFCKSEHVVYAGDDISIRYVEEYDLFLAKKKCDYGFFEAYLPVDEVFDWVKEELAC